MKEFIKMLEDSISLKDDKITITPEMDLVSDIGMTSLDMMVVIFEIEHRYNRTLPFEKLVGIKTVMDLYTLATQ